MKKGRERHSFFLCAVLVTQLILPPPLLLLSAGAALGAGVTPDPNAAPGKRPSLEVAPNGVPVVNITAANGAGLSHNQYHDFNVRQQGLILNNGSAASRTQLGGIVAGNPNFHGNHGLEARTILNEVTSANRSRIEGYMEVGGRAADVILANPNGVTINGGGFINVPRATITTGRPEVDAGGALRGYEVRGGEIAVEGAGVNADNTDAFTLLARTARVEAEVRAKSLAVVTGRNRVGVDGTLTPLPADPAAPATAGAPEEKPEVGIDSSALGGMYAGRIFLIATEKGVGVNLEGTVQSADQMVITADGKLRLREAASGGDATLASKGDIELTGASVTAARDLGLSAENVRLQKGVFEPQYEARKAKKQAAQATAGVTGKAAGASGAKAAAGAKSAAPAQAASPAGSAADPAARASSPEPPKASVLYAGGNLSIQADALYLGEESQAASGVDSSGRLTKKGGTSIAVNTLHARQASLLSGGSIAVAAAKADLAASTVAAADTVMLSGGELNLAGGLVQGGRLAFSVERAALTQKARAEAAADVALRAAVTELSDASLSAGGDLVLDLGKASLDAQSSLAAGADLSLRGTEVTLEGAFLAAGRDLAYTGQSLANLGGVLYAARDQRLATSGLLLNDSGEIYAGRHIVINSADGLRANTLRNLSGVIAAAGGALSIEAATVENAKREFEISRRGQRVSYNARMECRPYADCDHRQWWYYTTVDNDVITRDSPLAQMLAAEDISIDADLVENRYSTVAAGKNLSIRAGTLNNVEAKVQRTEEVRRTMKGWDGDDDFTGEFYEGTDYYYTDLQLVPALLSANGILSADVGDTLNNLSERQGIALPGDPSAQLRFPLSSSPMFRPSRAPGHHYLIETNPLFTNLGNFYGSDYFLSRIGLDQTRQQAVLLGDAFYETRLVQQEILASTGRRFLDGYSTDADQMRGLMDNAAAQAQDLNLTVGVALSADQVAALTRDIIWLVEEEHLGEKVLVPHVYLASASQADTQARGGLQAREVYVHAGQAVANEGAISGGTVNLAALNITSTGGLLSGGTLRLAAGNNIYNNSGIIHGGEVALAAGGDIVSQTLTATHGGRTQVLAQAAIQADNSLTVSAGRDVALKGSALAAGGDAVLAAGRDLQVGAVADETHFDVGKVWEHSVTHTGSTVAVGGALQMTAAHDLTVAGSGVASGGDATLAAGRNLTVTALQDQYAVHAEVTSNKGGLLSSSSKSSTDISQSTAKSSRITAGGNLTLVAGAGHATVLGSALVSGKDLTVAASGNVNVASAENSSQYSHSKSTVGALGLSSSSKQQGNASVSQVGSTLTGENVKVTAGENITATASNIFASHDVQLNAENGSILLDGAQNTQSSYYKSSSSQVGIFGGSSGISFATATQKQKGAGTGRNIGSAVMAGNDITMSAQNDVTSVGSLLSAANNVEIQAGRDVNLLPGSNTAYAFESSKKSEIGIGAVINGSGASLSLGYQSTAKGSAQDATQNAGSLIEAGNDIRITSGRDMNQIASHMEAGRDVSLTVGRDWNMLAGHDKQNASAWRKDVQAGLTLSLQENVSSAVQSVANLPQALGKGQGGLGYEGVTAAGAGLKAVTSVYNSIFQVVSASLSVGGSSTQQKSSSFSSTASPSTVLAGRDLEAVSGRDIVIEGGRVQAGHDLALGAGRDLNILAAANTYGSEQSASSASGGVSVSLGFGGSGMAVSGSVSGSASGSQGASSGTSYTNALVAAGNHLETTSGRDTNVKGAQVQGKTVDMVVGRDLNVHSLQDTAESRGNGWSLGGSIGFDATGLVPGKIAGMPVTPANGSGLSIGGSTSSGQAAWVNGQTSITAREGLDIYTEKNTDIKGALIAADNGNLVLNTGSLTYSDIQDKNKQETLSADIGLGGLLNNASLSGNYNKTDQEQINRATVGAGTVIIRSDPDKGLEGLNRDIAKAQELTKNEKVNVTVYVDSTSIKELASGFEGSIEGVEKLGENLQQIVREWKALTAALPESAKHLGQAGLDAMQAMLRGGASSEQVAQLMNDPEFQRIITGFASINAEGQPVSEIYAGSNGKHVVEITRPSDGAVLLSQIRRLYEYVESLPYKEEISAALFGVQAVCAGPIGLLKNMLSGEVMDAATQKLATYFVIEGVHKGEEWASIYPEHELASQIKATKFFLDLGLGVGVGVLAGNIKFVGKEPISTIPSKTNGQLLGANGVFLPESKTIMQKADWRIDIENTNPGKRPASLHLQIVGDSDKYYYNPTNNYFYTKDRTTGMFVPVSVSRNKEFLKNRDITSALQKALHYLGE